MLPDRVNQAMLRLRISRALAGQANQQTRPLRTNRRIARATSPLPTSVQARPIPLSRIVRGRPSRIGQNRHSQATGQSRTGRLNRPRARIARRRRPSLTGQNRHSQATVRSRTGRLNRPRAMNVRHRRSPIEPSRHSQATGRSRIVRLSRPRAMSVRHRRSPIEPSQHSRAIDRRRGQRRPSARRGSHRPRRKNRRRSRRLRASKGSTGFLVSTHGRRGKPRLYAWTAIDETDCLEPDLTQARARVIAPSAAELTSAAYFAKTPVL